MRELGLAPWAMALVGEPPEHLEVCAFLAKGRAIGKRPLPPKSGRQPRSHWGCACETRVNRAPHGQQITTGRGPNGLARVVLDDRERDAAGTYG